jgi:hypothetical protein
MAMSKTLLEQYRRRLQ